jgi:hypothetical protein
MCVVSQQLIDGVTQRLSDVERALQLDTVQTKIAELEAECAKEDFWADPARASKTMATLTNLKQTQTTMRDAHALLDDLVVAYEFALDEMQNAVLPASISAASDSSASQLSAFEPHDATSSQALVPGEARRAAHIPAASDADAPADTAVQTQSDMMREAQHTYKTLTGLLDELELNRWFCDPYDQGDAIVTIKPGQGGLEAQDWCAMLLKMYCKYCERKSWRVTINDCPQAEVIGIDRATFTVHGVRAYGMLKAEAGVHRLVRISPTDAKHRRQTTFAGVEVIPVLPEETDVEINPQDVRVDVFHASGPGGQGVNTTDSAVRLTHMPSGIVVSCQNERSQLQNKAAAMEILKARLYELQRQQRASQLNDLKGLTTTISWGNQIRNYILYPFQLVKDTRTQVETGNVDAVLQEGNLDPFIIAYLRWKQEQGN